MKHFFPKFDSDFNVLGSSSKSQAAVMVLKPGEKTGGEDNKHENSDQWLFVISGEGIAKINETEVELNPGMLVLIEAGETHEIENNGVKNLETLNFYAPPEY